MNSRVILKKTSQIFNLNIKDININEIGNSANLVYELQDRGKELILRISKQNYKRLPRYEAEMDYLNYLFCSGAAVSKVISSINNKFVEVIYENDECYFISIFEKAKGHLPAIDNPKEWNESLFYNWGKTMGKIHRITKGYKAKEEKNIRNQWDEDIYFKGEYAITDEDEKIYNVWNEIIKEISILPICNEYYGLIHNDFHQYNFFINEGNITVFDFDDCLYNFYVCDIAIAIYHSLQTMSKKSKEEFAKFGANFIKNFLEGYIEENKIDQKWIDKIPLFLEYRRICSYNFFLKLWKNEELNEFQKQYLESIRHNIVNRVPYIDTKFNYIKIL